MKTEHYLGEAYSPSEIARKVESMGVGKAQLDTLTLVTLAVLAGALISFGALAFTVVMTGSSLGFGITRLLGGAELFTGNNLLAMAWASKRIRTRALVRNWFISYIGNLIGCLGTVLLALWADVASLGGGSVGDTALGIASGKAGLSVGEAFARGILCNVLVCLAVWLAMGAHNVAGKILAIIFPISAFVILGFEHSIANWFFLPYGMALDREGLVTIAGAGTNLIAVTAGNIVGGTLLVASVYWLAYLRGERRGGDNAS